MYRTLTRRYIVECSSSIIVWAQSKNRILYKAEKYMQVFPFHQQ